MENISITMYEILNTGNKKYRIIYIQDDRVIGCLLDTTKLVLEYISLTEIREKLSKQEWKLEKDDKDKVVDVENLEEPFRSKFLKYKKSINKVNEAFGPSYLGLTGRGSKPAAAAIMEEYDLKPFLFWKICRQYLQSGCKDSSLVDKRAAGFTTKRRDYSYKSRAGRPNVYGKQNEAIVDDTVRGYFNEALENYKSGRQKTYKGTYEDMLRKHYTIESFDGKTYTWELESEEKIPSYWQYYDYARNNLSQEDKDAIRTSKMEQRNNKRLLLSDAMKGVKGPGDMAEIDALESDISLVSERDREQTIGRGILYLMIDVWSRVILAISAGFENNSVLADTNLLLNLADDKREYAHKFGIDITPELWPSNIVPRRIRVDRGADFRSDKFENILNGIGTERLLAPAGTGSLKGVVEQEFHQIQANQNDIVENNGLITKRHDSNHHKEAKLTIKEFNAMCINFVVNHNQKYQEYYKINKKMQDAHVTPIPIKLWEYGCRIYGKPKAIPSKAQFCWNLLTPTKASLNREGLKWKGLYYLNASDKQLMHQMYIQQRKIKKVDVKYDPRDIGTLYYLRDGEVLKATLNPDKFGNEGYDGITYKEYTEYLAAKRKMDAKGKRHNRQISIIERSVNHSIVESVQSERYADTKDMREEREKERQDNNRENAIANHLKPLIPENKKKVTGNENKSNSKVKKNEDIEFEAMDFEQALEKFSDND